MGTRTTAQWRELLDRFDIPNMPMNTPEDLLADPHLRATGFVDEVEHPTQGRIHALAHPLTWGGTPPACPPAPAPLLGQHTREVLRRAGYLDAQITAMCADGACATTPEEESCP